MARTIGSWWIKDGIDGRRIEAQGFASCSMPCRASTGRRTTATRPYSRRTSSRRRATRRRWTTWMPCRCRPTATRTRSPSRTARCRHRTPSGSERATSRSSPPTHASCSSIPRPTRSGAGAGVRPAPLHVRVPQQLLQRGWPEPRGAVLRDVRGVAARGDPVDAAVHGAGGVEDGQRPGREAPTSSGRICAAPVIGANTYNELLTTSEPADPTTDRSFWTAHGSC